MHLKRNEMPKTWPVERKGTTYLVRPINNLVRGIPLLIVLRNMLEVGKTKKEIKNILNSGKIKVNGKVTKNEKLALTLFDNLSLDEKKYKIVIENKKFGIIEDKNEEKISKIIGKTMLKKGTLQINLNDGRNYITQEKVKTGDSAIIDLKGNKISKILEFKDGCKVMFISGKHMGETGNVEKIEGKNIVVKSKEKINTKLENLLVIK